MMPISLLTLPNENTVLFFLKAGCEATENIFRKKISGRLAASTFSKLSTESHIVLPAGSRQRDPNECWIWHHPFPPSLCS